MASFPTPKPSGLEYNGDFALTLSLATHILKQTIRRSKKRGEARSISKSSPKQKPRPKISQKGLSEKHQHIKKTQKKKKEKQKDWCPLVPVHVHGDGAHLQRAVHVDRLPRVVKSL